MLEITDIPVPGYELVRRGVDSETGLHAIIAIHSTVNGPALGGMRMWPYPSEDEALTDVKRLAKGMTYKAICAGLALGGGKSVVIGDPSIKSEALLRSMGDFVESFDGKYITAEDMNTKPKDMVIVREQTRWVTGVPGKSGNPSPFTAHGCYLGLKAALEEVYGSSDMTGKVLAVEGCGSVGSIYAEKVHASGGKIICADIVPESAERLAAATGGEVVAPDEIHRVESDVFAPCAMGGSINDRTIGELKAKAVVGCANNQLLEERHGDMLTERGILYAPDYVVNAGGLINVYQEVEGTYDEQAAMKQLDTVYSNLKKIFQLARNEKIGPERAADRFAEQRLAELQAAANA